MEPARAVTDARDSRFDGLHAEATAAVGYSANTLRSVRERYQRGLRRDARPLAGPPRRARRRRARADATAVDRLVEHRDRVDRAADAAEAGAEDARRRALRGDVDTLTTELGEHQARARQARARRADARAHVALPRARRRDAPDRGRRTGAPRATSRCASSRPRRPSARASPRRSTTARPRRSPTRSSRSSTSSG